MSEYNSSLMFKTRQKEDTQRSSLFQEIIGHKLFAVSLIFLVIFLMCAILAPIIAPYDPLKIDIKHKIETPSIQHIFGTDYLGRDMFSRILYGARTTLTISFLTVGISVLIGISGGLLAGYYGGFLDMLLCRIIDILLPFPGMIIALALLSYIPAGIGAMVLALSFNFWASFARLIRNETYSIKNQEFVLSAKLSGLSDTRIMIRHILPNIIAPIIVLITLEIGSVILHIAALSFIGIGIPPDMPEWGAMVSAGKDFMRSAPLLTIIPGLVITAVVLLFNILGEELRKILNPLNEEVTDL